MTVYTKLFIPSLPRLKDDDVFHRTLIAGTESRDFFGFAQGKEEGRYVGFSFGKRTSLFLDASLLLIAPAIANAESQRVAEELAAQKASITPTAYDSGSNSNPLKLESPSTQAYSPATVPSKSKKQFYGTIDLDPIQAKKQFADLVDEVVQQFTIQPGVKVKIAIEIQAESTVGFDEGVQRVVKENCKVLRFKNNEFEDGND